MSADEPLIHARGLVKKFGDLTAVDAIDFDVTIGEAFGFLGPNGAGKSSTMRMIGCVSPPTAGTLRILGLDPVTDGARIRGRLGVVPAAGHPRQRADRAREPDHLRALLRALASRGARAGRPAARVRPARRARGRQGRAALGRDEASPHDCALARQRARGAAARRADDRARSTGAPRRLGQADPAQAAGCDARADDALHGRGGAAVRPARDHGPRPHRGGGLAARADPPALDARGGGAPLRAGGAVGRCRRA